MSLREDNLPSSDLYGVIERLLRLRDLLRREPRSSAEVLAKMPDDYADGEAGRRQLRRDLHNLEALGYIIQRQGRPVQFFIAAGTPILSDEDISTLAYLRDMFTSVHPLSRRVHQLINHLTRHLTEKQCRQWQRRAALCMPLSPALDYRGSEDLLSWLEQTILNRRQIGFLYHSKRGEQRSARWHPRVDPYEIEYTDRQFFLVAYSYQYHAILTYRIDRIIQDTRQDSPRLLATLQLPRRERKPIFFTYRLPASFADGGVSERFTIHAVHHHESSVIIEASDTSEFRIVRTLLAYGEHALLLDAPPSLLERMRKTVAAMYGCYFPDESPGDS